MARVAWTATLRGDSIGRYVDAHREIPAQMARMIREAGVRNYSIHLIDDRLFGYYECDDPQLTLDAMLSSTASAAWAAELGEVFRPDGDHYGLVYMTEVFRLE